MGAISMRELFPSGPPRRLRHHRRGIGYEVTPGSGFEDQYQAIEEKPIWGGSLPAQSFAATKAGAPAMFYRFPSPQDAYLNRSMQLAPGVAQGQVYSGEIEGGLPAGVNPLLAALYPQLQTQFATPWTNPWNATQFFGGTPTGMPVWGGGVLQAWQPIQGVGPAKIAAPIPGQGYPEPGSAIERF
jgi:hypothetical protein